MGAGHDGGALCPKGISRDQGWEVGLRRAWQGKDQGKDRTGDSARASFAKKKNEGPFNGAAPGEGIEIERQREA